MKKLKFTKLSLGGLGCQFKLLSHISVSVLYVF